MSVRPASRAVPPPHDPHLNRDAVLRLTKLTLAELTELLHKRRFPAASYYAMGTDARWRLSVVKQWLAEYSDYVAFLIAKREESSHAVAC